MATDSLFQSLQKFKVAITPALVAQLTRCVQLYELRDNHPSAFNTPNLGIDIAHFLPSDAAAFFDICNVYQTDFAAACKSSSGINSNFNVASNDFNLFCIWLVYLIHNSSLSKQQAYDASKTVLKYLNYKFFTGRVQTSFPHGARPDVMTATIDNLSGKCDIRQDATNTWRKLIEAHCEQALEPNSIHEKTFKTFKPDKSVVYVLSDLHTRISSKILTVATAYYDNYERGIGYGSTSIVGTDTEGDKELQAIKSMLDGTVENLAGNVLNLNLFIDLNDIKLAAKLTSNIRDDQLKEVLLIFSKLASEQYAAQKADETVKDSKTKLPIYTGYRILIRELIQKTYRRCYLDGVNLKANVEVLNGARNIYRSSRITDVDILAVKNSVDYFITHNSKYTRQNTLVSLRIALILYFIIQSFKCN